MDFYVNSCFDKKKKIEAQWKIVLCIEYYKERFEYSIDFFHTHWAQYHILKFPINALKIHSLTVYRFEAKIQTFSTRLLLLLCSWLDEKLIKSSSVEYSSELHIN